MFLTINQLLFYIPQFLGAVDSMVRRTRCTITAYINNDSKKQWSGDLEKLPSILRITSLQLAEYQFIILGKLLLIARGDYIITSRAGAEYTLLHGICYHCQELRLAHSGTFISKYLFRDFYLWHNCIGISLICALMNHIF